jgi:hypothetical protein
MKKLRSKRSKIARSSARVVAAPATSSKTPIKFSVNVVLPAGVAGSPTARFLQAGTESPFRSINEVPSGLRGFIMSGVDDQPDQQDESPVSLNFILNSQYAIGEDGRRGRSLQREVVRLEQAAAEQEYWQERVGELTETEEAALKAVQQDRELSIGRDIAEAQYRQREREMATEHAEKFVEEGEQIEEQTL